MEDINFYLPDFYYNYQMNMLFVDLQKKHPEVFREGAVIKAIYGAFPPAIWNGGRCVIGYTSVENVQKTVKLINEAGVSLRYTYTNCLLDESHLNDNFCNLTMRVADNGMNEVIINSEILEGYIREKYPNYKLISSTTKRLLKDEAIEEELKKDYDLIVLDYALNNEDRLFTEGDIIHDNAGHFELLVNAYCQDDCPIRKRHYRQLSRQQLDYGEGTPDFDLCNHIGDDFYRVLDTRKRFIKVEDLYGKYYENGYRHFKIEGRTMKMPDILESYVYYMIKPEFQNSIRLQSLRQLIK
jgi:hypothetical protein